MYLSCFDIILTAAVPGFHRYLTFNFLDQRSDLFLVTLHAFFTKRRDYPIQKTAH